MRSLAILLFAAVPCLPMLAPGQEKAKEPAEKFDCEIVYVPTDQAVVDKMLEMAKVTKDDVVFDLGCGDGRIVCTAAKKYGAKGVGIDIDALGFRDCLKTMRDLGVTKAQVEIRQGDALKVKDLERATVVMLYMLPAFMAKLEPQLKRLKPGTRVVAHDYPFPNVKPDQLVKFSTDPQQRAHSLYLWTIRAK